MNTLNRRQYFAGYELDSRVFMGDEIWTSLFDIKSFSLETIFSDLFSWIRKTHEAAQIPDYIGASFHFKKCNGFLVNQTFRENYLKAVKTCSIPYQSLCHIPYRPEQLPTQAEFISTLLGQIESCVILKSKGIIIHPPSSLENTAPLFIQQLTQSKVLEAIEKSKIYICIENAQDSRAYFQSLKNLIQFREELEEKLYELGKEHINSFFKFCFDTGHYLLYQQRDGNGTREWEQYAKNYLPHVLVFHIHSNDGSSDQHLLPYTKAEPPIKRMPFYYKAFFENCHLVMDWLEESDSLWSVEKRFFVLEVNPSFTKDELISFWHRVRRRLKLMSR